MNAIHLKKFISILLISMFYCNAMIAQSTVSENKHFKSTILNGEEVQYSIYLPESYGTSDRAYPVLYLLHGYSDNHTSWVQKGQVKAIADKAIANGQSDEMIIVMPNGKVTWYINNANGKDSYEDMFFQELIPHIESTYRAVKNKESRAIAGLSMGGHGSLIYTLRHPDTFVACCPLSAAVCTDEEIRNMSEDQYNTWFKNVYGTASDPKERPAPAYEQYNTFKLIKNMSDADKRKVKIYVSCGDDDFLFRGNAALWVALREANIPSEFRVLDGGHSWSFWRKGLESILPTISNHFHRL